MLLQRLPAPSPPLSPQAGPRSPKPVFSLALPAFTHLRVCAPVSFRAQFLLPSSCIGRVSSFSFLHLNSLFTPSLSPLIRPLFPAGSPPAFSPALPTCLRCPDAPRGGAKSGALTQVSLFVQLDLRRIPPPALWAEGEGCSGPGSRTQRFYYSQKTFLLLRLSGIRPAPFLFFLYLKRVDFTGLHCRLLRITLKTPPSKCRVESRLQHSLLQLDFKRNLQPGVGFEKRVRSPSWSVIRIEWQGLGIIFKMISLMLRVT